MSDHTLTLRLKVDPEQAEVLVREALADEGFGILTEIDVQATLKAKLDVDVAPYRILGACNPALAHRALQSDPSIGVLLPCNVVVRAHPEGGTEVMAVDPIAMLEMSSSDDVAPIAADAAARIGRAMDVLAAG